MTAQHDQSEESASWYFARAHAARQLRNTVDLDPTVTARLTLIRCSDVSHARTLGFILRDGRARVADYLVDTERCLIDHLRLLYCVRARLRAATCVHGDTYVTPQGSALEYDETATIFNHVGNQVVGALADGSSTWMNE